VLVTADGALPAAPSARLDSCPIANLADGPISPTAINSVTTAPVIAAATIGLRRNMVESCKPIDLRTEVEGPTAAVTRRVVFLPKSFDRKRSSRLLACSGTWFPSIDSFEPPRFVSSNSSLCGSLVPAVALSTGSYPAVDAIPRPHMRQTSAGDDSIPVNAQLRKLSTSIGRSGWDLRDDDRPAVISTLSNPFRVPPDSSGQRCGALTLLPAIGVGFTVSQAENAGSVPSPALAAGPGDVWSFGSLATHWLQYMGDTFRTRLRYMGDTGFGTCTTHPPVPSSLPLHCERCSSE
jgi:hypothetical protein